MEFAKSSQDMCLGYLGAALFGKGEGRNEAGEWEERESQKGQEGLSPREGRVFAQPHRQLTLHAMQCRETLLCSVPQGWGWHSEMGRFTLSHPVSH